MGRLTTVPRMMAVSLLIVCGCLRHSVTPPPIADVTSNSHYQRLAKGIEYPEYSDADCDPQQSTQSPMSLATPDSQKQYLDMSLEEVMTHALSHSTMLRDLGGTMLRSPDSARSKKDASLVETDPRYGIEGALSAFDANFTSRFSYENNNRAINNVFFGGGTRLFQQDLATSQTQISKTTASGTNFAFRNYTQYDANNAPGNLFPGAYTTWFDLEGRQPLLRGSGTKFNRVAGPNAQPGFINGVLIARINSDISLADFELAIRNFVSDVENAYWDLYFAYRDLDAKNAARNEALETWRQIKVWQEHGQSSGAAEREAQAREQYYRAEEDVQNALNGRLNDGTRTANGSSGGTFRGYGGIYVAERRLRLLIGMPISDGRLIRPSDEPIAAKVEYHWEATLIEGLTRRAELRRQKWQIKKREAELEANKNFLKPQLDVMGRYRFRGFGEDLFPNGGTGEFNNALDNLLSGNFQEWQAGFELSIPLGFRQAYAAVRHSEMQLARERALLQEQERSVVYDLSNAVADVERAFQLLETTLNRRIAAAENVVAIKLAYEKDRVTLDAKLDAQRRLSDAEVAYFRSRVEYQIAVKNVQFERGTLLEYNEIYLNEGSWPEKAYDDAEIRESLRGDARQYRTVKDFDPWVSQETSPRVVLPSETFDSPETDVPSPTPTEDNSPGRTILDSSDEDPPSLESSGAERPARSYDD